LTNLRFFIYDINTVGGRDVKLQECINFILTNVQNSINLYFKKELQALNVTPIQYALLKCLWEEDDQMPTQLAQTLCLDSSSVTGILGRLEEKGLVVRDFCTTDRRRITVHLTDTGRALQKPVEEIIDNANVALTSNLSEHDMAKLKGYLQKIADNANKLD
jgi:MarR family transcriptional regulator, organic hydroperoxide resistance regulator